LQNAGSAGAVSAILKKYLDFFFLKKTINQSIRHGGVGFCKHRQPTAQTHTHTHTNTERKILKYNFYIKLTNIGHLIEGGTAEPMGVGDLAFDSPPPLKEFKAFSSSAATWFWFVTL
jgi:hypothetical protein